MHSLSPAAAVRLAGTAPAAAAGPELQLVQVLLELLLSLAGVAW